MATKFKHKLKKNPKQTPLSVLQTGTSIVLHISAENCSGQNKKSLPKKGLRKLDQILNWWVMEKMWPPVIKVKYQSAWHELVQILMKCHPVSKQAQHFCTAGSGEKQILHIIYLFIQDLFKGLWRGKILLSFWHNILEPHFILSLQCRGMLAYIPSTSHVRAIFSAALYGYLTN